MIQSEFKTMETSRTNSADDIVHRTSHSQTVSTDIKSTNVMWSSERRTSLNSSISKRSKSNRSSIQRRDTINDGDEFLNSIYGPKSDEKSKCPKPTRSTRKSISFDRALNSQSTDSTIQLTNIENKENAVSRKMNCSVTESDDQRTPKKSSFKETFCKKTYEKNSDDFDNLIANSKYFKELSKNVTKMMETLNKLEQNQADILNEFRCRNSQPHDETIMHQVQTFSSSNGKLKRKRASAINVEVAVKNAIESNKIDLNIHPTQNERGGKRLKRSKTVDERSNKQVLHAIEAAPTFQRKIGSTKSQKDSIQANNSNNKSERSKIRDQREGNIQLYRLICRYSTKESKIQTNCYILMIRRPKNASFVVNAMKRLFLITNHIIVIMKCFHLVYHRIWLLNFWKILQRLHFNTSVVPNT